MMEIPVHPRAGTITNQYLTSDDGTVKVPAMFVDEDGLDEARTGMTSHKWKEGDVLLATFPKNGTNFMWEIMTMLLRGSEEYIRESKALCMIDLFPVTKIEDLFPSPRALNTHYRLDVLPSEFRDKKTVLVIRNPKDTCVSFFYHETKLIAQYACIDDLASMKDFTFSSYLKMFLLNKDVPYGSYFDYIDYMWSLRDNPNILIVYFEDLKLEPVSTIQKVNEFMGTGRSPELVEKIADVTTFSKMKEGKAHSHESKELQKHVKCGEKNMENANKLLFRKGEIGDWKRHFTVADNELFDSFLEQWSTGKEIPFKYI